MNKIISLMNRIQHLEEERSKLQSDLTKLDPSGYIRAWLDDLFGTPESLAESLNERDFPMRRRDIIEILSNAGIEPTESLIALARPDSEETYRNELRLEQDQ